MTRITVNEVNYNVEVCGSGIPLVMLHGFTASTHTWAEHVAVLARSYTVITVDLLGHGRSDAPGDPSRYEMHRAARDLVALLDAFTACPVNLLGYSMGGRLALYLARYYPEKVRTLVLESASPGLADPYSQQERRLRDETLAARIERDGIPAFVDYWESIPLFASQQQLPLPVREALHEQRLANNPAGLANSLRGMGTGMQPSLWDDLWQIRVPVLLLTGEHDHKFVGIAEQMQARLPDAHLQVIPGAGHTVHLEQPHAFQMQVMMFVHTMQFADHRKEVAKWPNLYTNLAAVAR